MSVNSHLTSLASTLVLCDREELSIATSIYTLSSRLTSYFGSTVTDHFQFGSSTRGTILPRKADNHSDIDYMVVFNISDGQKKPQTYLDRLRRFVELKYSTSEIYQSHPTIVLSLNHINFELVPAIYNYDYQIPSPASSWLEWTSTDPSGTNQLLQDKNKNNNFQIKPLVRLVKYWNTRKGHPFSSFSIEQHIVSRSFGQCSLLKDYFYEFWLGFNCTYDTAQYIKDMVNSAKQYAIKAKEYEKNNMPDNAELQIKKNCTIPMNNTGSERVDEVSQYYAPIKTLGTISVVLFWSNAALSFVMPYSVSILGKAGTDIIQVFFLVLVLIYFSISQVSSLYLVPRAELMRRKQLLSDSFGVPLSHDHTSLYYNNFFSPSVQRLGANTMENALFSKEIASKMLGRKRVIIFGYLLAWLFAFSLRYDNLGLLTWITQLVFSGEIIAEWLKLEILRFRHERTYDELYSHFLHKIGQDSSSATANVLNAFVNYEAAKSTAGILLSTEDFQKLNPILSKRWKQICQELDMK